MIHGKTHHKLQHVLRVGWPFLARLPSALSFLSLKLAGFSCILSYSIKIYWIWIYNWQLVWCVLFNKGCDPSCGSVGVFFCF
jgi:hypothetical protein